MQPLNSGLGRRTRIVAGAVAIGFLAATALYGCTSSPTDNSTNGGGDIPNGDMITYGAQASPNSFDPANANNNAGGFNIQLTYANVLEYGADGKLTGGLADTFGYTDQQNEVYQFKLKSGLKFADGTPITAQAAVDSITHYTKGYGPGPSASREITAKALDDLTVELDSTVPNPSIPDLLGPNYYMGALISPAGIKALPSDPTSPNPLDTKDYGAGPYTLDTADTVQGTTYVFDKNPNYYDAADVHYAKFTMQIIQDPQQAYQALQSGQVNFIEITDQPTEDAAKAAGLNVQVSDAWFDWDGIHILDQGGKLAPALANEKVRQAMNYAIDRKTIAQTFFGDLGEASTNITLPTLTGYDPALDDAYPYDPAKAKQLLAEAGYPNGFDFKIAYAPIGAIAQAVQAAAQDLQAVGINAQLDQKSFADWIPSILRGEVEASPLPQSETSVYLTWRQQWMAGGSINPLNNVDPDAKAAFDKASVSNTQADWAAANKILVDKAWTIPLLREKTAWAFDSTVAGIVLDPRGFPIFEWGVHPAS